MATTGLSSLISNTGTQSTSLPSWYDAAQQNVVNQATAANAAAPAASQTVAQNAVNALSGPTNAFTTAGNTLQNIASGAASPWNVDASGNVTPNTNTALGGLFQAQNQQLNTLLPQYTGAVEAGNIASGNFGSLRGQTAVDAAKAAAQSNLLSSQMSEALQNQATGVQAGTAAGNVAQQNINNLLTTGEYQQSSPYVNAANLGNIIAGVQAPSTVSNTTQLSPLNQISGLATLLGGGTANSGIISQLFGTGGTNTGLLSSLGSAWNSLFPSSTSDTSSSGTGITGTTSGTTNSDGSTNYSLTDGSSTGGLGLTSSGGTGLTGSSDVLGNVNLSNTDTSGS